MKKLLIIGILVLNGCTIHKSLWFTGFEGKVICVDGDKVCVQYDVLNVREAQVMNCFYHSYGHSYQIGDVYPDFSKHYFFGNVGDVKIIGKENKKPKTPCFGLTEKP